MNMYPSDILTCKIFEIEELLIILGYFNELILFLNNFLSLLNDAMLYPLILDYIKLLIVPKYNIVDLLWQVSYQVIPLRAFSFLVLVQKISQ